MTTLAIIIIATIHAGFTLSSLQVKLPWGFPPFPDHSSVRGSEVRRVGSSFATKISRLIVVVHQLRCALASSCDLRQKPLKYLCISILVRLALVQSKSTPRKQTAYLKARLTGTCQILSRTPQSVVL